jgi:hypothetical protein
VRIAGSVLGLFLVFVFLRSALQVAILNRQRGDWLARQVGRLVYTGLRRHAGRRRDYGSVQDVLAWVLPLYMLLLIVVWFLLVQAGFSLLIWSSQAEHSLLHAVIASGSALSTLGFLTPPGIPGQLLAIPEGAMGLGIVVFYFTFIPGYQQAIQTREAKVAWLYARAGTGLTNFALVEWSLVSGAGEMSSLWEAWEAWFRSLLETHGLTPVLAFVPTVHRGQTWLAAAAVALDSASFCLAALDMRGLPAAEICHQTGVHALQLITAELSYQQTVVPAAPVATRFGRADFDAARDRVAALGAKVKPQDCWNQFLQLRGEYQMFLPLLANQLLVPVQDDPLRSFAVAPAGTTG